MRSCKLSIVPAAVALMLITAGCQSSGHSASDSGPSRSFGLSYVPQQSEPPVDESGAGRNSATRLPEPDANDDEEEGKTGARLTRLLTGKDNKPAERKTLPLSAKSKSVDNPAETEE